MQVWLSDEKHRWFNVMESASSSEHTLSIGECITEDFKGFGCCFNELGWEEIKALSDDNKKRFFDSLFSKDELAFSYNRLPIGANDYSTSWYSHNETDQDFEMKHFSIDRDFDGIIPYIREASSTLGDGMTLFASPWSPPTWMKTHKAYNYGNFIWEDKYLKAYAEYFVRFIKAYDEAGITIDAVHVQNEPDSDQKFPSCVWTGQRLADFIKLYLSPAFKASGLKTEIWLGTIERPSFNDWVAPTLLDPETRDCITGVGFQWAGKAAVQRTRQAAPDLPIIQTENECGDGLNTWDYAHYIFDLARHYLMNGSEAYVYWNAILKEGGISTWGWQQNSLFSVEPITNNLVANPEYYVMRHFAKYVRSGAKVFGTKGSFSGNSICFRNLDQSEVFVIQNPLAQAVSIEVISRKGKVIVDMPAKSFSTVVA